MVGEAFEKGAEGSHAVDGGVSKQHYDENNQDVKSRIYTKQNVNVVGRERLKAQMPWCSFHFTYLKEDLLRGRVFLSRNLSRIRKNKQQDIGMLVKKVEKKKHGKVTRRLPMIMITS